MNILTDHLYFNYGHLTLTGMVKKRLVELAAEIVALEV